MIYNSLKHGSMVFCWYYYTHVSRNNNLMIIISRNYSSCSQPVTIIDKYAQYNKRSQFTKESPFLLEQAHKPLNLPSEYQSKIKHAFTQELPSPLISCFPFLHLRLNESHSAALNEEGCRKQKRVPSVASPWSLKRLVEAKA